MRRQVIGNRLVQPGLIAQLRLPVRIGQTTHVKYEVGVYRHAPLEAKGLNKERGAGFRLVQQAQLDGVTQLVKVQAGGVDLEVGQVNDRPQQLGLVLDGFGQRAVRAAQRVAATGFRKALEQRFFVGIQVQHVAMDVLGAYLFEQFREAREVAGQVACVNGHRHQRLCQLGMDQGAFCQLGQQAGRQVVDAIEAAVLKYVEGRTFT